jgi:hypothetical protein
MHKPNFVAIAQMMMRRHGLRAQAVARERAAEMRLQGDAAGLNLWQAADAAIRELRRIAASRQPAHSEAA